MSEPSDDYPFLEDWLKRQAEPEPSGIDWEQRSPLSFTCIPEKEQEVVKTLFNGKEKE